MAKIAVRYIGEYPVLLHELQGPHLDGDGKPLSSLRLSYGDTLMMEETEVRGQTYFQGVPKGVGKQVDAEHEGLEEDQLTALGYRFDTGRSDFEPLGDNL